MPPKFTEGAFPSQNCLYICPPSRRADRRRVEVSRDSVQTTLAIEGSYCVPQCLTTHTAQQGPADISNGRVDRT